MKLFFLVVFFAATTVVIVSSTPCTQQWECISVASDYNYVSCSDGQCACRTDLGFSGSATAEDPCRCEHAVYWGEGAPYCKKCDAPSEIIYKDGLPYCVDAPQCDAISGAVTIPWKRIETTNENPVQDYGAACIAVVDHFIYQFGGLKENRSAPISASVLNFYAQLRRFDTNTYTWTAVNPVDGIEPPVRAWASMTHQNGNLYLFGGAIENFAPLGDFWMFNIAQNKWTDLSSLNPHPAPRTGASMINYGQDFLMYGGVDAFGFAGYNELWLFTTNTQTWSLMPAQGTPPPGAAVPRITFHTINGDLYLYVFGGEVLDFANFFFGFSNDMYRYHFASHTWAHLPAAKPLERARAHFSAANFNGQWSFVHGDYGSCDVDLLVPGTALYDFSDNVWYDHYIPGYAESPATKRSELGCVGTTCYLIGGYKDIKCTNIDLVYMNEIWRYEPINLFSILLN